jgi:ribosomal protein S18 acetylase RimI-like enzyme
VFPSEELDGLASREADRERHWRGIVESPSARSHTLVAERADEVVGFASLGPARDDDPDVVGELYAIYVLPEAWGQGVGQALMTEVLGRLREERFHEALLWVLEDNPRTRRYYELAGWRVDGEAKDDMFLDTSVREMRYRISLEPS